MAFPLLPILGAIGGIGSVISGIGQSQAASQAAANQAAQLELLRRLQDYQFKRQAQVDPIFLDLLSQALVRTRGVPRIAGAYGPGVVPLMAALRGSRIPLPKPRLIGEEPVTEEKEEKRLPPPPTPVLPREVEGPRGVDFDPRW